ncbi:MAG: hypothetical protein PHR35_03110 [Kiritimatiellae bacterium]|nr:hypothetical protein [Kiritimatiellia bacterium]
MKNTILLLSAAIAVLGGVRLRAEAPADPAAAMAAAMQALGTMAEKNAASGVAVDPKAMRALLPEKDGLAGFKRTKISSESNASLGFRINTAKAEFAQLEGDGELSIQFQDISGLNALAKAAMMAQDVDEETENGFRRTATYQDFKAEEEYDGDNRSGSIKLIAGDRISVEISGHGVSFETLKAVIGKLDLKKLAALKAEAAPAPANPEAKPAKPAAK